MNSPLEIYQVDAFTDELFKGNPAAVVPLRQWLPEAIMQQIAAENNLAETVFFVPDGDRFLLRWFTPAFEVDLCGHATLAAAWVLFHELGYRDEVIRFHSPKSGPLRAKRQGDQVQIDLPSRPPVETAIPQNAEKALGYQPLGAFRARDMVLLFEKEEQILNLDPKPGQFADWDVLLVVATAPGRQADFVSRAFDAHDKALEDPVTGSAHASLVPFWAERLHKTEFKAVQLSERTGVLHCVLDGDRVLLSGHAVKYMRGEIFVRGNGVSAI